jgi:hypothetical protein
MPREGDDRDTRDAMQYERFIAAEHAPLDLFLSLISAPTTQRECTRPITQVETDEHLAIHFNRTA